MKEWERDGGPRITGVSIPCSPPALAITTWRRMLGEPIHVKGGVASADIGGTRVEFVSGSPGDGEVIADVTAPIDLREVAGLRVRPASPG